MTRHYICRSAMGLIWIAMLAMVSNPLAAEEVLRELDWSRLDAVDLASASGSVVETDQDWSALKIEHRRHEPVTVSLAQVADPGIVEAHYALIGQVRYQNVTGDSYLEMWNVLPGGERFFSRTLAPTGPSKAISGTSAWRSFVLPAHLQENPQRPIRLEFNLTLLGPGVVELGPVRLVEFGPGEDASASGAWWSPRGAALFGSAAGVGLGLVGALLGVLVGFGKARGVATVLAGASLVGGAVSLVAGIVAWTQNQPYSVYYPLLLIGGLTTLMTVFVLRTIPRRYAVLEMRRMEAIDAS